MLVVGGIFGSADGVAANDVAAWDGRQWHALGGGLLSPSLSVGHGVTCLAVHNGELYAGGKFGIAASDATYVGRVAKWNGSAWVQVGPTLSSVNALASLGGELYVGGDFVVPTGAHLAKLVGNDWVGFGAALPGSIEEFNKSVDSLAVQGDSLLVGGSFARYIMRQDAAGVRTQVGPALATSFSGTVTSIYANGQDVYIAGSFARGTATPGVMHWDGAAWTALAAPATTGTRRLVSFNSDLYLSSGASTTTEPLYRWTGSAWTAVFPAAQFQSSVGVYDPEVLGVFDGHLILGGSFTGVRDNTASTTVTRLMTSLAWMDGAGNLGPISHALGARVASLSVYHGKVIAAGRFTTIGPWMGGPMLPGSPGRLAEMDADGFWLPFTGGLPTNNIWATEVFENQLVVGGEPFSVGGVTNTTVAAWDGAAWHDMSAGAAGYPVRLVAAGGQLWGEFVPSGGAPSSAAALGRWNGAAWQMFSSAGGYSGLLSTGAEVYATDDSTSQTYVLTPEGLSVLPLPPSETTDRIIGAVQGDLVCASGSNLYRWNGQSWAEAGDASIVATVATSRLSLPLEIDGVMYVGAQGGLEEILAWDGLARSWRVAAQMPASVGSARPPSMLPVGDGRVLIGGAFDSVFPPGLQQPAQAVQRAAYAAVWSVEPVSVTTSRPPSMIERDAGQSVVLEWELSPPPDGASYEWTGPLGRIYDGAYSNFGVVSGATTNALRLEQLIPTMSGYYSCQAVSACGTISLSRMYLSVAASCSPDVNNDGVVDEGDVDYLINVIAGGENPESVDPDFNHDGVADQTDVEALVNAVAGGGCP
ncbi:MAG: hypothetical protein GC200_06965 [Tepidisphaera sp.]|nr:hypothetical protein [Tepidisphaera sp.]